MSDHSAIEWTDATWNPTTGCTKISPGCAHCYIERTPAFRIAGNKFVHGKTDLTIFHDRLEQPLHWRKPRRVFVNSLSDLFHDDIGDAFIDQVFAVMALAPQHTFQVLTKRAERMRDYCRRSSAIEHVYAQACKRSEAVADGWVWPLPNVWLGVSVENQHFADERIPLLLQTPAAVRFISAEPLLGAVDLKRFIPWRIQTDGWNDGRSVHVVELPAEGGTRGLDWVIVGGESGNGARPFHIKWARSIVDECKSAGVPVFIKQLGSVPVNAILGPVNPVNLRTVGAIKDRKGGEPSEWPEDLRVREFPVCAHTWELPA